MTEALRNVSFSCPQQKISCMLGPNGAGKTTIIKILAGLVLPDIGEAVTLGVSLSETPLHFRRRIGLATSNERSFYWRLTGRQNLNFYAALYGLKRKDRERIVLEVLSDVDILEEADKPYRNYSSGMKQRLLLARALLGRPEILLLDEPTTHLDHPSRTSIHRLIRERFVGKRKTTVFLCTNDLTEAMELGDHLIFLHEGEIQAEGTLASLRAKMQSHLRLVLEFDGLPHKGWEKGLPAVLLNQDNNRIELEIHDTTEIPKIVEASVSAGGKLVGCQRYEEPLSKIFARLTGGGAS